jgi:2-polyprenyl-3-methyl-5-hydroxy-6-metoxy-1,4-benzoquinol methylase
MEIDSGYTQAMDADLQKRLVALNREFYARFAQEFSRSRTVEHVNLSAIMPYLRAGVKLLEIGCGSGRLAERLDREKIALDYLGVDVTPEFIEAAHRRSVRMAHVRAEFQLHDITAADWAEALRSKAPFDVAVAAAVLHHIPGFEPRCAVLAAVRSLLRTGGILVLSNWQFQNDPRLLRKVVPWDVAGIDERTLEEGDALIDWKRGGSGYRYCHLLNEAEVERAASRSGYRVLSQINTDRDLNLWSVLQNDLNLL